MVPLSIIVNRSCTITNICAKVRELEMRVGQAMYMVGSVAGDYCLSA